jgi:DNA mismatch endonuclease (patch repair protein)
MMSGIRGRNTKPERVIRSLLHREGFRFRIHAVELPGKPDLVLPRYRAAIFVNGCFWHGHDCRLFKWPSTRIEFWRMKISRNQANDAKVRQALRDAGWRVGVIWECALRGANKDLGDVTSRTGRWIRGKRDVLEIRE